MTTVGRIYRFRGFHSLPDFPEPWCFPHEHDYTVEVVAAGGVDTLKLDHAWAYIDIGLRNIEDMNAMFQPSTVENIAENLLNALESSGAVRVTIWEDRQRWGRAER